MDESVFQELQLRFNIEYWLEPLAPITFETQFVPIGAEEARLFIACYTHLQVNKLPREELPQELQRPLSALQARLEACVASVRGHESEAERVFVKGSPRSAKDATIVTPEFAAQFDKACAALAAAEGAAALVDDRKVALMLDVATQQLSVGAREQVF